MILQDSKQVMYETGNLRIPSGSILVSADIIDFYEKINLNSLIDIVGQYISKHYTSSAASFIKVLFSLVARAKFFEVDKVTYMKTQSLSVGEHVATAAANVFRAHHMMKLRDDELLRGQLTYCSGYVDDCFLIWGPGPLPVQVLYDRMKALQPDQIDWTFTAGDSVAFLDLVITMDHINERVYFKPFRKPQFRAQYLPAFSYHPASSKSAILKGEIKRYLYNSTNPEDAKDFISKLIMDLNARGYTYPIVNNYKDTFKFNREEALNILKASRGERARVDTRDSSTIPLVLPHGSQASVVRTALRGQGFRGLNYRVAVASGGKSLFQVLYPLNFQFASRAQLCR